MHMWSMCPLVGVYARRTHGLPARERYAITVPIFFRNILIESCKLCCISQLHASKIFHDPFTFTIGDRETIGR